MAIWKHINGNWEEAPLRNSAKGLTAFVVCHGPSFNDVDARSLQGAGRVVIGVNSTYPALRPDYWTGMDNADCYDQRLWNDPVPKILRGSYGNEPCLGKTMKEMPGAMFADVSSKPDGKDMFVWYNDTLMIALQFAQWLGCTRICLVGVDLNNRNADYADSTIKLKPKHKAENQHLYDHQFNRVATFHRESKVKGIEVVSCSKGSRINSVIPFVDASTIIKSLNETLPTGRLKNHVRESLSSGWKIDPYSTHLQALVETLEKADGDVLELGCGNYSSPVIRSMTRMRGHKYVIATSDQSAADKFRPMCDELIFVDDWGTFKLTRKWSVIMMDNEQLTSERVALLPDLLAHADKVILHDAELQEDNPVFKCAVQHTTVKWYRQQAPNTAVIDGVEELTELVTIAVVCKSGGEYKPEHANRLLAQIPSGFAKVVLTDFPAEEFTEKTVPLQHGWKGWWSKMELFSPDAISGNVLFFDLDTTINHFNPHWAGCKSSMMLNDFGEPNDGASGVMFIREENKRAVWSSFLNDPQKHIAANRGDQDFIASRLPHQRWQDQFSGDFASFKFSSQSDRDSAKCICYHGQPKPWS